MTGCPFEDYDGLKWRVGGWGGEVLLPRQSGQDCSLGCSRAGLDASERQLRFHSLFVPSSLVSQCVSGLSAVF